MTYVNPDEFTGYIARAIVGWKVVITGRGLGEYETPMVFRGWTRDAAIARADRWSRRVSGPRPSDEPYRFDPGA